MLDLKSMKTFSGVLAILLVQCIVFATAALAGNVVINEFDLNPRGADSANEWLVLYNPSEVEADISGWTLATTHGKTVTITIPQGTRMAPRGYWTYIHEKQWLDNEGELIILSNAEGVELDRTLLASDRDNDNRYWARYPDGLDTNSDTDWRFKEHRLLTGIVRGGTVKHVVDGDTVDVIFATDGDMHGVQRIRLVGLDAPELDTVEGGEVTELVKELCLGKVVEFDVDDERPSDKYHRILAVLYVNELNLNVYLLREGYAKPFVILPSEFIPCALFTYSPEQPVINQMITFDASPSYSLDPDAVIISCKWDFGDGTIGAGEVVNHTYTSAGNYAVSLTVTDSDGKIRRENIETQTIVIKSK